MCKKLLLPLLFFGVFCSVSTFEVHAQSSEPAAQAVDMFLSHIRALQFPIPNLEEHHHMAQEANQFLSLDEMVQKALAKHWEGLSVEDREAFMDIMWKLIEVSAYSRGHSFLADQPVHYPQVSKRDRGYQVHGVVHKPEQGFDVEVIYYVEETDQGWKIYDILLDEISLIEDLQYQFDKIIEDETFSGLLKRMNESLETAKSQNIA